jgi:uncharacterized protein (TIGR02588 family)
VSLPKKNYAEWIVFGLSMALVLGAVGFLAWQIGEAGDEPARIMVELGPVERRDGLLIVPLSASNEGDGVAEQVVVEVALEREGAAPEIVELTFSRLARREMAEGEAVFEDNGAAPGGASARVLSYTLP